MRPNKLYMVIPCYNEEEVLPETARRLREKLELDPANPQYIRTKWGVGYYLSSHPEQKK